MPLPKITTPTYELELPSTKQTVKFRPFLVKEEKLLVLALESEDTKNITTAIKTVLIHVQSVVKILLSLFSMQTPNLLCLIVGIQRKPLLIICHFQMSQIMMHFR